MRKTMFIFVLLLAFSIGVIFYAHITLSAEHENVSFTEVFSFGDISAADGLTVSVQATLVNHLFWDSVHTFGETPATQTDFRFSSRLLWDWEPAGAHDAINLSIAHSTSFSSMTNVGCLLDEIEERAFIRDRNFTLIEDILRDLATRARDGQWHFENIFVKDYFDYYPISVYIDPEFLFLDDYRRNEEGDGYEWRIFRPFEDSAELNEVFSNFFRFPVLDNHTLRIGIQKNREGNVVQFSVTSNSWLPLQSSAVITENGIYFVVWSDTRIDFSNIRDGFGIFLLPSAMIVADEGGDAEILTLDIHNLSTVFPLCEYVTILSLNLSDDGSALYLLTIENETLFLTVIEIETMTEMQKLPLLDNVSNNRFQDMHFEDGFLFMMLWDGRVVLADMGCDNIFQIALTVIRDEDEEWFNDDTFVSTRNRRGEQHWAWDGTRLAFLTPTEKMFTLHYGGTAIFESSGFLVEIFDSSGLRYKGVFENSLDALGAPTLIRPRGFSLSWGD